MLQITDIQEVTVNSRKEKIEMLEKEIADLKEQIPKTERRLNLFKRRLCRDLKLLDEIKGR